MSRGYRPTPRPPVPLPPGFLILGMLLATLGAGCTLVVTGAGSDLVVRAVFAVIGLLTLVLVEALWWVRPWVARAADAWAAACLGTALCCALAVVVAGGLGIFGFMLFGILLSCFVVLPCTLARRYVRDRARRLGLAPGIAP